MPRLSAKRTCLQRTSCILGGRQCLVRHAPLLKSWCCCDAILKNYNAPLVSCGILNAFFDFLTLPMQVMPTCTASKAAISACAALVHGTETQRRRLGAGGIRLGAEWTCHAKMAGARAGLRTDKEWVAIYGNCFLKFSFFYFSLLSTVLLFCFFASLCFSAFSASAFFVSLLFCFSAVFLLRFSFFAYLLFHFVAFLLCCFSFFASLLFCFCCFSPFLLFCFVIFLFLLFCFCCSSAFLLFCIFCFFASTLVRFFASLLFCFVASLFFLFASLLLCFPL